MKLGPLQINFRRLGIFVIIGILLVLVMDFNNRMENLARLQAQAAIVRAEATSVMVAQVALQTQVAEATSQSAVDKYAREQARLAKPGDKLIIPLPQPGTTPAPSPTPVPELSNLSNMEIWLLYLFDTK